MSRLFSSGLWVFAQSEEKYGGYVGSWTVQDQIKAAASVPGLKGLELIAPMHVSTENVKEVKSWMDDAGLTTVAVNPYLWTEPQWRYGAISALDPKIRAQAVDTAKKSIDIGRELGCGKMDLWPGEDGWDYMFQVNYGQMWDLTADSIRHAEHRPTFLAGQAVQKSLRRAGSRIGHRHCGNFYGGNGRKRGARRHERCHRLNRRTGFGYYN